SHNEHVAKSDDASKQGDSITREKVGQKAEMRPDMPASFQHEEVGRQEQASSQQDTQHNTQQFFVQKYDCVLNLLFFRLHEFSLEVIQEIGVLLHFCARSDHCQPDPYCSITDKCKAVPEHEAHAKSPKEPDENAPPGDRVTPEELLQ